MKRIRRVLACVLVVLVMGQQMPATTVQASTLEERLQQLKQELDKNKQEQKEVNSEKKEAQDKVDGLKNEEKQLGYTYNSLNKKLQGVYSEIDSTENAISTANSDIEQLEKDLEEAKKNRDAQYEGMKKRIQFMYENGTDSILVSILTSGSVAEFVKRAEYASMIASYDREMVSYYDKLQETIVSKSAQLEEKKQELSAYQETLKSKQGELKELVGDAGNAYASKKGEVSAAQMSVDEFDAIIADLKQKEAANEQQYAAIQAEMAKQYTQDMGGVVEDTSGALNGYSQDDLILMAAIIQAEAGGESYAGQLAVGTVIMNRVMSNKFPNTLEGVIYQKNQFQPVRDGHLALILERGPNESCTQAARETLGGYRSGDWLFFMTKYWADYYGITGYTMIGNHAFFRVCGAN